jgi:hypothetical protein
MGWFRPRRRFGTWLALAALALNLAFSFGHNHFGEAAAHAASSEHRSTEHPTHDGDEDHSSPAHRCFVCIVVTVAAIAASAPAPPARIAVRDITEPAMAALERFVSARSNFEARAPPRA